MSSYERNRKKNGWIRTLNEWNGNNNEIMECF